MTDNLNQRLIGATIITILLITFIPMFLDNPVEIHRRSLNELNVPELPDGALGTGVKSIALTKKWLPEENISPPAPSRGDNLQRIAPPTLPKHASQLSHWIIEAGNYDNESEAIKLRDQLRQQKFTAYIEFSKDAFRVRVGPEVDKTKAEKTQTLIENETQSISLLIPE
ncbi:MAG TPA: SPOR domain-containing protein [Methylococcaceae bacterium]|jgi:DedD protein|nr:SPOR domain-containing protein [Methylococcaceae bacterium]HIN69124.1 SPOR domain-containing protein [Methylococcales bacterium]HIA45107.1 SPOR domain-containing protein [Methylococcaceae bacterium]HIB63134.1 SPOR domain-containing protein [Methylococcaceae bacterium]HIO12241.1 SPOR domain-containing protein [Methylococcales bacterium]